MIDLFFKFIRLWPSTYLYYVVVASALFYAGYWLLMRKEKRHQLVRFYLLGTLALSLILPAIHIPFYFPVAEWSSPNTESSKAIASVTYEQPEQTLQIETLEQSSTPAVEAAETNQVEPSQDFETALTRLAYITIFYGLGCLVMFLLLIARLLRIGRKLRHLDYTQQKGYRLALVEGDQPAFSFFHTIVIGKSNFSQNEISLLLGHELVHVRRHHSYDVLFCELLKIFFWFNPFLWLYARDLKRVHEFQADEQMMSETDGTSYAELLYHQLAGHRYSTLGNNFDYRITQKRIKMIQQNKKRLGSLSLLIALPVIALMLFKGCKPKQGLEGTFYVSNMYLTNDDAEGTELWCLKFLNLRDREFTFHKDGTVDVVCTIDSTANFTGTYTLDEQGLRIYGPDKQLWLNMEQVTDFLNGDSISITYTDLDPIHGMGTMMEALAIGTYLDTIYATNWKNPKDTVEMIDTVYPEILAASKEAFLVKDSGLFHNRMLRASNGCMDWLSGGYNYGTLQVVDTMDNRIDTFFFIKCHYPEGHLHQNAKTLYDSMPAKHNFINPKRDDYKFKLRVELKRKTKEVENDMTNPRPQAQSNSTKNSPQKGENKTSKEKPYNSLNREPDPYVLTTKNPLETKTVYYLDASGNNYVYYNRTKYYDEALDSVPWENVAAIVDHTGGVFVHGTGWINTHHWVTTNKHKSEVKKEDIPESYRD